jgi:hypothetical protein
VNSQATVGANVLAPRARESQRLRVRDDAQQSPPQGAWFIAVVEQKQRTDYPIAIHVNRAAVLVAS